MDVGFGLMAGFIYRLGELVGTPRVKGRIYRIFDPLRRNATQSGSLQR
ncbi:MAG: hypothetical protein M2R45_04651 [Verrucomicrobia subdivision 3 bacterium]|nr:hypothetical protein [Limisphaerales bacterium]MCS1417143.1 hypothetical protein [Limisphaerales bacterium]